MKINITGKHMKLSDTFKYLVVEKMESLGKYLDTIQYIDVVISKTPGVEHHINLKAGIPGRGPLVVQETGKSLHAILDLVRHKAENVLTSHKEKIKENKRS